jgi:molybdopterin/thiamine biosynthesis adenylyltransferase
LGSIVAEQLAHLGVGNLILIDPDVIDETNLNRVVGANHEAIGKPKVTVAEELVKWIHPRTNVSVLKGNVVLTPNARSLLIADFLFCCTDSHGSRAVLNQLAYQYMIPMMDLGVQIQVSQNVVHSITGRIQMLAPGLPCLVCRNLLDPEEVRRDLLTEEERARDRYIVGVAEPQPAVISLNGSVASLAVTMMLSAVTGFPVAPRHQIVMFERGVVRAIASPPEPHCVICSLRGVLGRGDLWPMPGRPS